MGKVNNAIMVPTSLDGKFFKFWLEFLRPFHKLTDREIEVVASLLKHRYELSKKIKDPELLEDISMNEDTKRKVREEVNISSTHFQVMMSKLRKNKVIVNGRIEPKFIPKINEDDNVFQLLVAFKLK